jgi:hypothetical protein
VGIKLVRVGRRGETIYHPQDITQFFKELQRIDPTAIILNHKKDNNSAKTIAAMTTSPTMDYKTFLDLRTDNWGGPSEHKSRTMWMFYVASDTLTPSLSALRQDSRINQYLLKGGISMQFTKLLESNSRILFHVANKDPTHTNRIELEARLEHHINRFSHSPIKMHLLNMEVTGHNFKSRMCTAVVGGKDQTKVEEILTAHPFEDLDLIMFSWKRKHLPSYTQRLREHERIIKMCRAIKVERVDPVSMLDELRRLLNQSEVSKWIVDIFPANHANKTGVAYIQYLQERKQEILEVTQRSVDIIINQHKVLNITLNENPRIVNAGSSISPTIQTDTTSNCKSASIPRGRYADIVKNRPEDEGTAATPNRYIPRTIRIQPTRFAECLNGNDTAKARRERQEEGTLTTGNTSSGKTEKEMELEAKNARLEREVEELKKGLQTLQVQMGSLLAALTEEKKKDTTPQRKKYKMAGNQQNQQQLSDETMEEDIQEANIQETPTPGYKYLRPLQDLYENTRSKARIDNTTDPEEGVKRK